MTPYSTLAEPLGDSAAWLLLDVDGVLNLDVSNSVSKQLGLTRTRVRSWRSGWSYTLHLQTWLGDALRDVAPLLRPAWCTTWYDEVDHAGRPASISRVVGLAPGLPRVNLGYYVDDPMATKVSGIEQFFESNPAPFAWIDDDPMDDDREQLTVFAEKSARPNLFVQTDPAQGLTREQFDHVVAWAASL